MLLYALLPLCAGLFMLVDSMFASGALRMLAEGAVVVLVSGLAATWVRANRHALSQAACEPEADSRPSDITLEVHAPSPRVIHLGRRIPNRARELSESNNQYGTIREG